MFRYDTRSYDGAESAGNHAALSAPSFQHSGSAYWSARTVTERMVVPSVATVTRWPVIT